jgi:hypothetical protein
MTAMGMPLRQPRTAKAFLRSRDRPRLMIPTRPDAKSSENSFSMTRRAASLAIASINQAAEAWGSRVDAFSSAFLTLTCARMVLSPISHAGISERRHIQIWCAVCRRARGAFESFSRMSSTNGMANAIFGRTLGFTFRFGGTSLFSAARTVRRCTLYFWATPLMVPTPCSYSRRIRL